MNWTGRYVCFWQEHGFKITRAACRFLHGILVTPSVPLYTPNDSMSGTRQAVISSDGSSKVSNPGSRARAPNYRRSYFVACVLALHTKRIAIMSAARQVQPTCPRCQVLAYCFSGRLTEQVSRSAAPCSSQGKDRQSMRYP